MKIRIGNDIRLRVNLAKERKKQPIERYYANFNAGSYRIWYDEDGRTIYSRCPNSAFKLQGIKKKYTPIAVNDGSGWIMVEDFEYYIANNIPMYVATDNGKNKYFDVQYIVYDPDAEDPEYIYRRVSDHFIASDESITPYLKNIDNLYALYITKSMNKQYDIDDDNIEYDETFFNAYLITCPDTYVNDYALDYSDNKDIFNYVIVPQNFDTTSGELELFSGSLVEIKQRLFVFNPEHVDFIIMWPAEGKYEDERITLSKYQEKDNGPINVNGIDAIFVNTSKSFKKDGRYILNKRYPIEPLLRSYIANAYDINGCGKPCYNYMPIYSGFGSMIHSFDFAGLNYKKFVGGHGKHSVVNALVKATDDNSKYDIYFPACLQKQLGEYSLILKIRMYEEGYMNNNIKTVTVDYNNVFELVGHSYDDCVDNDVVIDIDTKDINPDRKLVDDVYTYSGAYNNGLIDLRLTDGRNVSIDMSSETEWYEGD